MKIPAAASMLRGLSSPYKESDLIVVTGARGFIGANLALSLTASGEKVLAVDKLSLTTPMYGLGELKWVEMEQLHAWLEAKGTQIQAIAHLGACSDTTVSDRDYVMRVNLEYTRKLWNFCTREKLPFIYASSAATYGDGSQGYDDESDPKKLIPLNLYGESKQLFDLWALEQTKTPPRWAGLKYFNVYGPREEHKGRMASVAFHSFNQIKSTGLVKLFKSHKEGIPDGGQQRDFVFVEDAVRTTRHFLETVATAESSNGLYNCGTGQARSFADLATAVFSALKLEPNIEYIPMPEDLRGKYQYFTQASTAKRIRAGVSKPFHSIEAGVEKYVRYLVAKG